MFKFDLQLFGGGGKGGSTSTSTSSYTPSEQELQLTQYALNNANTAQSGIQTINNLFNSGVSSSDFSNILGNASNLISSGQNTYSSLMNGELPSAYTQNMTDSIKSGVTSTVGSAINDLASRGVLNSSVTNQALNDIESNVADTMAEKYSDNISTVAGLAGQQISNATAGYNPYSALTTLGQNQNTAYITSPLSALSGKGTTTTTQEQSGASFGDLLTSAAFGLGTGWIGKQMGLTGSSSK